MAGKSGRSINNVPKSPVKQMIFSWEGILVLLFIAVNIFCANFSEFYNLKSLLRQMPVYLAEIFLMKALPMPWRNDDPVVALDQQEGAIQDDVNFRFRRLELHGLSQRHAEAFVDHTILNGDDSGLQDVGAGRALKGQADALAIEHHRQFVLGACQ